MQQERPSDPQLERIASGIRSYHRTIMTVKELINLVFLELGQFERYDLVDQVTRLIPESARGELRRLVEEILQSGVVYVPFVIGRSPDPEAWRQRMISPCRRLAALFKQQLDTARQYPGHAESD